MAEKIMDVLGIDLAKLSFDATLLQTGSSHYAAFPNTPEGFLQLATWLREHNVSSLHACMEATNIYWQALASWLHAQSYSVSVVNPARIKVEELHLKAGRDFEVLEGLGQALQNGQGERRHDQVERAVAERQRLLIGSNGPIAINKVLYDRLPFDPDRDLTPLADEIELCSRTPPVDVGRTPPSFRQVAIGRPLSLPDLS
jgi:hypothetical protein